MRVLLFALCMLTCTASFARDLDIDDLLGIESHGQVFLVPERDLVIVERRAGYAEAADFGYDTYFNSRMVTRILATSMGRPGTLRPLFPQSSRAGYWIGSISPGRTRMAVFRLQDRKLSLGVVDLATSTVRWLPSSPDLPGAAPGPVWIDEDRLVYVAMTRDRLPASLSGGTAGTRDLVDRWTRQSRGDVTRTLVSTMNGAVPDDGEREVILAALGAGSQRVLARGDVVDLSVAPSGKRVVVVLTGRPVAPAAAPINAGFDSRRHRLLIVDVEAGRSLTPPLEVLRGVMSWSSDDRLLVVSRDGGSDWTRAVWAMVDASGQVRRLGGSQDRAAVEEVGAGRLAHGGWTGTSPLALMRNADGKIRWMRLRSGGAEALPLPVSARLVGATPETAWMLDGATLFSIDRARVRIVTREVERAGAAIPDPYALGFRLVRDPPFLPLIVTRRNGSRQVLPLDGTRLLPGIDVPKDVQVLAATQGTVIVGEADRHAVASVTMLRRERAPVVIDQVNVRLKTIDLPRAIDLNTKAANGQSLHDWLLLPSNPRPPLVVTPYPGLTFTAELPREAGISRLAVPDNALLLVAAGYAVLLPSMPLAGTENPADGILPRIDEATDAAIATGLVDGDRVGVQGHSFGGYAAMTVATRSDRYKAIVAANGPYDLLAMHGNMPAADKLRLDFGIPASASIGWTEGGQGGIGAPPATALAAYLAASPMMHLDRVRNPILLITGDLDPVDATQAERAFMELYRLGKDAVLARYWGEGHANASSGNIRDYWRSIVGFFDDHLKSHSRTAPTPPTHSAKPRRRRAG